MSEKIPTYIGWYQPHAPVNWTGEVLDAKTGEVVKEPTMTKQSFKEECDINNIIKRFEASGIVDHLNERAAAGQFTDLPDMFDFQQALNVVAQGNQAFMVLPADLRARFDNDAAKFLDFFDDPANQEEAIKLGLAKDTRPPPPPPEAAPKAPEAPPVEGPKK